jgi:TetR/AcrR family transcriptional regulator
LKPEKQERIINAAMKEFVKSGYEKASTNEIVKDAQISKGSLFNYFSNKKDLYFFLIRHAVNIIEQIYDEIDMNERDIFERISQIGSIKFKIQRKYPIVFDFLKSLVGEESQDVRSEITEMISSIQKDGWNRIYENIEWSKLQDGIEPEKAMNILNWTMSGFGEMQIAKIKSFGDVDIELLNEWDSYKEILKRCFYKNGE